MVQLSYNKLLTNLSLLAPYWGLLAQSCFCIELAALGLQDRDLRSIIWELKQRQRRLSERRLVKNEF